MKPIIIAAKKEGKKERKRIKHLAPVPFSFQNIISRNGMVGRRDNSISLIHLIRTNANTPVEF